MAHTYAAPLDDIRFVLEDVVDYPAAIASLPGCEETSLDDLMDVLGEAAALCSEVLLPLNRVGDSEGCQLVGDSVRTPPGFVEAYEAFAGGGWTGIFASPDYGGAGLPHVAQAVLAELLCATNVAFSAYVTLGHGAYQALVRHGSPELARALPAEPGLRPLDRDDVPDRASCRHRPRAHSNECRPGDGRQLPHHGPEDLHHLRRPRPDREHRPPRARRSFRMLPRARAGSRCSSSPRPSPPTAAATGVVATALEHKMGICGDADLRDVVRGRLGRARRRAPPGHAGDVHDDEHGAARRRPAGPRPRGGRLPAGRRLRARAPPGSLAGRARAPRRSRPTRSSSTPTCAVRCFDPLTGRGRPGARALDRRRAGYRGAPSRPGAPRSGR